MDRKQHDAWLRKNNCHPEQIKSRKGKLPSISCKPKTGIAKEYYKDMANTVAPPVLSNTIWDKIAHGETLDTINEIRRKATMVLPAYNKGGLTYIGNKDMIKFAGKKL